MYQKAKESDWKVFRKLVPELRERYLRKRSVELMAILQDEKLTPTEQFWALEERVGKEAAILRKCLDGHSRASMTRYVSLMYRHRMLHDEDLEQFSVELAERIKTLCV